MQKTNSKVLTLFAVVKGNCRIPKSAMQKLELITVLEQYWRRTLKKNGAVMHKEYSHCPYFCCGCVLEVAFLRKHPQ